MKCKIVSSTSEIFSGKIKSLMATSSEGELGIMPGHTPLLTSLRPGPVRIIDTQDTESLLYVSGGFLEVQSNEVNILADTVIRSDDLDAARIAKAKVEVKALLKSKGMSNKNVKLLAQLAQLDGQMRTLNQKIKH